MLTKAQVDAYRRDGYVVPDFRLDVETLHGVRERCATPLRFMPTTSRFDRRLAVEQHERLGVVDHSERTLFLPRGVGRCARNDYAPRR